jgi:hypothetical protein
MPLSILRESLDDDPSHGTLEAGNQVGFATGNFTQADFSSLQNTMLQIMQPTIESRHYVGPKIEYK